MASNDLANFFTSIPPVTRFLFAGTLGITLAGNFGLISPYSLLLSTEAVTNFQVWRFLTCILFGGRLGFPFLMHLFFLYNYSLKLEQGAFDGRRADYVFFILFCSVVLIISGLLLDHPLIGHPLVFAIVYLWSQINREAMVSFMFGLRFKAMYLPWVLLAWSLLLGGIPVNEFAGIVVGHLYYFLQYIYPTTNGVQLLKTPDILRQYFPDNRPMVQGFAPTNMPRGPHPGNNDQPRAHNWGRGNRLGGN